MKPFDDLWDYQKPGETEQRFRHLLPAAEQSGDGDYLAQLLTQIARAQGLQRQFEQAHATLDQAETLLTADFPIARIRYCLERGRLFNSSKQPAQARPFFLQAYELGLAAGADFYTIDAAHMMGIIEPPAQQLEWNHTAIALAEKTADSRARGWLGALYNNIGWSYHDSGDYETALDIFQRAWEFRKTQGKLEPIRIAQWCVGRVLRSLNRLEEALTLQRQLEAEETLLQESSGYTQEEIAECLWALGEKEAARPYFGKAYQILAQDSWFVENETTRLQRLKTNWQNG